MTAEDVKELVMMEQPGKAAELEKSGTPEPPKSRLKPEKSGIPEVPKNWLEPEKHKAAEGPENRLEPEKRKAAVGPGNQLETRKRKTAEFQEHRREPAGRKVPAEPEQQWNPAEIRMPEAPEGGWELDEAVPEDRRQPDMKVPEMTGQRFPNVMKEADYMDGPNEMNGLDHNEPDNMDAFDDPEELDDMEEQDTGERFAVLKVLFLALYCGGIAAMLYGFRETGFHAALDMTLIRAFLVILAGYLVVMISMLVLTAERFNRVRGFLCFSGETGRGAAGWFVKLLNYALLLGCLFFAARGFMETFVEAHITADTIRESSRMAISGARECLFGGGMAVLFWSISWL